MSTMFPRKSPIDGERCWKQWFQPGSSLSKVSKSLAEEGVISPRTQKPYTIMSIKYWAWKWALKEENYHEAYDYVRQRFASEGRIFGEDEWKRSLVENARWVFQYSEKKLSEFIEKRGFQNYV